jgi:hypothetical protein
MDCEARYCVRKVRDIYIGGGVSIGCVGTGGHAPKEGALAGYVSSWTLAGTGGQIGWKQQRI